MGRSYQESCDLLDGIVGRCVRDSVFADAVLVDPEQALAGYCLEEHEMDDFRALVRGHREVARSGWSAIRDALPADWCAPRVGTA
jgi:hypothetical protein